MSRSKLRGLLAVVMVSAVLVWWLWPPPQANPANTEPSVASDSPPSPAAGVRHPERPGPPSPPPARTEAPVPPLWPKATVSSRYARVDREVFDTYIEQYAVKDWAHDARLAYVNRRPTKEEEREVALARRRARDKTSMHQINQLRLAVSSYRSVLVARESPHTSELYEHELILIAMYSDGAQPIEVAQERACLLRDAPRDCEGNQCGAWKHLVDIAATLCTDPTAHVPPPDPDAHVLGR